MTRLHAETYLRAELGKLWTDPDLAAQFREAGCIGDVSMSRQEQLDAYVLDLDADRLFAMARCLSRIRGNSVSRWMGPDVTAVLIDAEPGSIRVGQAEPLLGAIFAQLDWRLTRIAADPDVLRDPARAPPARRAGATPSVARARDVDLDQLEEAAMARRSNPERIAVAWEAGTRARPGSASRAAAGPRRPAPPRLESLGL